MSISKSVALGVEVERLRAELSTVEAERDRLLYDIGELVTSRAIARNERDRLAEGLRNVQSHVFVPTCYVYMLCEEALAALKENNDASV